MSAFLKAYFKKWRNIAIALLLLALAILATYGRSIAPYDPVDVQLGDKLKPPSSAHWLGTDDLGRDLFSRIIVGTRVSVVAAVTVMALSVTTGVVLGVLSGYMGGALDELLMRVTDIFLAFPPLILALAITAVLGPSLRNALLAISITWWPWYARLARGLVLSLKEKEYIEAARALGAPDWWIMLRHMIPNLIGPVTVQAALDMGSALVLASSLSFIGLGVQPPAAEWGAMISQGRRYVFVAWWAGAFPGLAIFLTVYLFNAFGESLNEALSPRADIAA